MVHQHVYQKKKKYLENMKYDTTAYQIKYTGMYSTDRPRGSGGLGY